MNPVAKALWFIESHFTEDLTLDDVASAGGVSRYHMSRVFGSATGCSITRYMRGRRLTEAARTLAVGAPDILILKGSERYELPGAWSVSSVLRDERRRCRRFAGWQVGNGKPERHPPGQAALQRMNSGDALTLELKRHPGARRFVRSRAVEDQIASPKDLRFVLTDMAGFHPQTAGNRVRHRGHVERRTQVHDRYVVPGVEAPLESFR